MKRRTSIATPDRNVAFSVVVAVFVALFPTWLSSQSVLTLSMFDALRDGSVLATFRGTGGSSRPAVIVEVSKGLRTAIGPFRLTIAPGTLLENSNGSGQNMAIMGVLGRYAGSFAGGMNVEPSADIVITDTTRATYVLSAFCANFDKHNPQPSDTFFLREPDPVFACIANRGQGLSASAKQAAVWMYTDRMTLPRMSAKFNVTSAEWVAGESVFQQCQYAAPRTLTLAPAPPPILVPRADASGPSSGRGRGGWTLGPAPPGRFEIADSVWNVFHDHLWSRGFTHDHAGTLRISPSGVAFIEADNPKDNFSLACSEIAADLDPQSPFAAKPWLRISSQRHTNYFFTYTLGQTEQMLTAIQLSCGLRNP